MDSGLNEFKEKIEQCRQEGGYYNLTPDQRQQLAKDTIMARYGFDEHTHDYLKEYDKEKEE